MSLAITHFAIGGSVGLLLAIIVNASRRELWLVAGGGWALLPDLEKVLETSWMIAFHDSPAADLFMFHYQLDQFDPTNSIEIGVIALLLLGAMSVLSAHHARGGERTSTHPMSERSDRRV